MALKRVIIRVDGNSNIGLGHIYRGIALAEMLKDDFLVKFVTKADSIISPIQDAEFYCILLPEELTVLDEPKWFKENYFSDDIIILDGYLFSEDYQKKIKEQGFNLVYVDDFVKQYIYADIVINHSLVVKIEDYNSEPYTQFALGTDYALLRPSFLEISKQVQRNDKVETILVCFGGSDINDVTYKFTKVLLRIEQIKKINIIIGAAYKHEKIFELQKQYSKINISKNLSAKELLKIMAKSDFAIAPASNILYELCSVNIPVLSGFCEENQKGILKSLLQRKAVFSCNNMKKISENTLKEKIGQCIKRDLNKQIQIQKKLFDGKSKRRIVNVLKALGTILREVNNKDLDLLYKWVNDKGVRENALNSKIISFEEHCNWFENIICNRNTKIYILEMPDGCAIGQIRFDLDKGNHIISYSIDSNYRGQGLGEHILKMGIKKFKSQINEDINLLAKVKKENIASVRIFSKLNFTIISKTNNIFTFQKKV